MSLFGSEDNNEDEVTKATQTSTVGAPSVDYPSGDLHTLVRDQPCENDDINNEQVFTPFTMRVY